MRKKSEHRQVQAGCVACHGSSVSWEGTSAEQAAQAHCRETGHEVWVEIEISIKYDDK